MRKSSNKQPEERRKKEERKKKDTQTQTHRHTHTHTQNQKEIRKKSFEMATEEIGKAKIRNTNKSMAGAFNSAPLCPDCAFICFSADDKSASVF